MKAVEVSLNTFLSQNKTQFVIPVYQRNYDWTEEQCKQLLEDIKSIGRKENSTHFIGSIVFIHEGVYTSSEVKQLVIIDGQQRLTTFTLLYLALYKYCIKHNFTEKAYEIYETYILNKFVKEDGSKLKLKQSDTNAKAFKFLLADNDPDNYAEFSRVIQNFKYLYSNISSDNIEIFLNGLNRLLFVEISLERYKDDPQRIFESLNSTGLELSQADLIRNYILMDLSPEEQQRVFTTYWETIENNSKQIELDESRVSDFIRDFLSFKMKRIPVKSKVYDEFKARYSIRGNSFYGELMQELKTYSFHYKCLLNPTIESDAEISKELKYINQLEINVAYPFLLPVYQDYKTGIISKMEFIQILNLIQSYTWRRFISNLPTNALGNVFMYLYNDVNKDNYVLSIERSLKKKRGTHRFPDNKEIAIALSERDVYNIKSKNCLYFFERLENHKNREFVSVDNPNITIEHIFPQTPSQEWKTELEPYDFKLFEEKYLNTISNLTLSGNNGSLSNKTFIEKKLMNIDNKQQGYKYSRLWLNQFLKDIDRWDLKNFNDRYALILNRFFEIWNYPEIEIEEDLETDEDFTIYNAPDPRFKKLDYFIFRNEKIEINEVSKMYYYVISKLFTENPSFFFKNETKALLSLDTHASNLRFPVEISTNVFIEGNIDNNNKFRRLKELLVKLGYQDDLLINFSELDPDQDDSEIKDKAYWDAKGVDSSIGIVEDCFQILKNIDPNLSLNYAQRYIGINQNNKANNFILFFPKNEFVRVAVKVQNHEEWIEKIHENNLKFVSVGKNSGRIRFRINKNNVREKEEFLSAIFKNSYELWMS